jgi:hypothetical protein
MIKEAVWVGLSLSLVGGALGSGTQARGKLYMDSSIHVSEEWLIDGSAASNRGGQHLSVKAETSVDVQLASEVWKCKATALPRRVCGTKPKLCRHIRCARVRYRAITECTSYHRSELGFSPPRSKMGAGAL